jgi:hypothetical protein
MRISHIQQLISKGALDADLRWRVGVGAKS